MLPTWFFVIALICACIQNGIASTCTSSNGLGNSNVQTVKGNIGWGSNQQYFMTDSEYISPCCGAITKWKIYARRTIDVIFQVWRPTGGSSASLVGENLVSVTNTNTFTYNVPTADQIDVETGDIIGWFCSTQDVVEYNTGGSRNDNNYIETISASPSVNDTVTYSNIYNDRTYAIYAQLDGRVAPTFTNLDASVSVYDSGLSVGSSVYTLTSSTVSGSPTYTLTSISPSSHFSVASGTGDVNPTVSAVSTTTYTLVISVEDACSASSSGTLTIIVATTAPVWSNLDASISTYKSSLSTSTAAYTVTATNPVVNGSVTYSLQSISPSSYFSLDADTGDVKPSTSTVTAATYTLVIRASDDYGNFVDGTLTITVNNIVPEIVSLPGVAEVSESAVDETLLHIVNVTDADGDTITCTMVASPSGPFLTKYLTVDGEFKTGLYLLANPTLDYSVTNAYELTVTCADEVSNDADILYVYVTPNNVPVITNLQNSTNIVSTTPTNTVIFTVLSTDAEEDTVQFSLTCTLAGTCPFSVYSDGSIVLTTSLAATTTHAYELDISVTDGYTSSGNHRLTVFVTDLNQQPVLSNLPATVQITEATVVGTTVFDASVYDEDGDTVHAFTAAFSPASATGLFQLNASTGEIVLQSALNYPAQANNYYLTIDVSDTQTTSTSQVLQIVVVDVNQGPVLYQTNYRVEVDEGSSGTSAPDPAYNVHDADGDTLQYSWGGGNDTSGFSINTTNGVVSFTIDVDVDDPSVEDLYVWLVVIADPYGLAVTATLTVAILDVDDNAPKMDSPDYVATVYKNAGLGTSVITITATDADKTEANTALLYTIYNTNHFRIDHAGTIFVHQSLESEVGTIDHLYIRVRSKGSSAYGSANVYISIVEPEDDEAYFDDAINILWVTLVCVLVPPLLVGVAYLGYRGYKKWRNTGSSTRVPTTQVAPQDTKMTPHPSRQQTRVSMVTTRSVWTPRSSPQSRASLVTRGSAVSPYSPRRTPATPSDIRIIKESWGGWNGNKWTNF